MTGAWQRERRDKERIILTGGIIEAIVFAPTPNNLLLKYIILIVLRQNQSCRSRRQMHIFFASAPSLFFTSATGNVTTPWTTTKQLINIGVVETQLTKSIALERFVLRTLETEHADVFWIVLTLLLIALDCIWFSIGESDIR